jgi:hypothetical protein
MQRRYITADVFTDRAFGGNPLAVVLDAGGLSTAQMQAIAIEFNYSETTFVLPLRDAANDAQVRILGGGVTLSPVMPGLDPGIHVFLQRAKIRTWMAGTSPAMTTIA